MNTQLLKGDCREQLATLPDCSIDSIVTDPPYELGFMGKSWDSSGIAYDLTVWRECFRVLKPGGHLIAFGGSRTYHRLACAVEDAGFEIRDQLMWVYGSGFPKSLDVSKAIDKAVGAEREVIGVTTSGKILRSNGENERPYQQGQDRIETPITAPATDDAKTWQGWGTALKPAHEPMVLARKPLGEKTVAENVLRWGTGALNIDGTRIGTDGGGTTCRDRDEHGRCNGHPTGNRSLGGGVMRHGPLSSGGRWPANFIHDGSDEVLELFPETKGGTWNKTAGARHFNNDGEPTGYRTSRQDSSVGSAARFFYCAKASKSERNAGCEDMPLRHYTDANKMGGAKDTMLTGSGNPRDSRKNNFHPTVKPAALMRYLIRLVTPPNGTVLDPFAGSGTTLVAAIHEQFDSIGIELTPDYWPIIEARTDHAKNNPELA